MVCSVIQDDGSAILFGEYKVGDNTYLINEFGAVYKLYHNDAEKKPFVNKYGYKFHNFHISNYGRCSKTVHKMVYETFVGPIPFGMTIDHVDDDKTNNHYLNLQLMTPGDNVAKAKEIEYQLVSPTGEVHIGKNIAKLCRHYGLCKVGIGKVNRGKLKTSQGWTKHNG